MNDAGAKEWRGGAYWHRKGSAPWSEGAGWATRYASWPYVRLRLDGEGGSLLYGRSSEPEIAFEWSEVESAQRVRVLALPFLGEGVRFTLKETVASDVPRRFLFLSATKRRSLDILGLAESKEVAVRRDARNQMAIP